MQQPLRHRLIPCLAALALFLFLTALWMAGAIPAYRQIIKLFGIGVWDFPFLDSETVLSGARCLRAGVDVYVSNPCDTLGRVYDYSPLWMLLAHLPVTLAWGVPIGLFVACLYLGALALLPPGRTRAQRIAIVAGAVSPVAVFAVERGNNDITLFMLGAAAAALACRSPRMRAIGYGCALLAGLLKYYPMALLALVARERPARLAGIALAAVLVVALFVGFSWHDLTRALGLIPTGDYFGDMFGSIEFAGGARQMLDLGPSAVPLIRWTMAAAALATGAGLALRRSTADAIATLTLPERAFLLAGGLLTLACFFTAQNIGYRALHLVLTLPGLLALRASGSRLFRRAPVVALAVLWSDCWRKAIALVTKTMAEAPSEWLAFLGWIAREALWWTVIVLLATAVFALLWRSTLLARRPILWA